MERQSIYKERAREPRIQKDGRRDAPLPFHTLLATSLPRHLPVSVTLCHPPHTMPMPSPSLLWHADFPEWKFSLYFVGYCDPDKIPQDQDERKAFCMRSSACVELTFNYGESGYHTGNSTEGVKGGFGHIGVTVPNVYRACERFKEHGVEFKKSPNRYRQCSPGRIGVCVTHAGDGGRKRRRRRRDRERKDCLTRYIAAAILNDPRLPSSGN